MTGSACKERVNAAGLMFTIAPKRKRGDGDKYVVNVEASC